MRKLDLILENIRDEYMINLLEEGTASELETLKTKKFLNENLNRIRKMLIEEGALEGVKQHLGNNWGKYLAGAGTIGAGALANHYGDIGDVVEQGKEQMAAYGGENPMSAAIGTVGGGLGQVAGNVADGISADAGQAYDAVGNAIGGAVDQARTLYDEGKNTLGVGPEQARAAHLAELAKLKSEQGQAEYQAGLS